MKDNPSFEEEIVLFLLARACMCILVPIALFASLSGRGLGTRKQRALETQDFEVLDSRTFGLGNV